MPQRQLVSTKAFEKAYKKFTGKHPQLKSSIHTALERLEQDAFSPQLKTRKLSGNLHGLLPARAAMIAESYSQSKKKKAKNQFCSLTSEHMMKCINQQAFEECGLKGRSKDFCQSKPTSVLPFKLRRTLAENAGLQLHAWASRHSPRLRLT